MSAIFVGLTSFVGCESPISENVVRSAQVSYDEAVAKEESGDLSAALPIIDAALAAGGLNPDQLANGYLLRARCYCAAGELEKAQADIDMAERGAPDPARMHMTRGILLEKQGKSSEAKSEFSKARKADPTLKLP